MNVTKHERSRFLLGIFAAAVGIVLMAAAATSAKGQVLVWDPTNNPSAPAGGSGTWSVLTSDWSNLYNQLNLLDALWTNSGVIASFGGATGGTVTLGSAVTAGGLKFTGGSYTLSGSNPLTLNNGTVNIATGATANLNAVLAGTAGLIVSGNGTLTVSNTANTYTGTTMVRSGTLQLAAAVAASGSGALGNASSAIVLGDTSTTALATVKAASTVNIVPLLALGNSMTVTGLTTLDGVSLSNGNLVLLKDQTTATQNGIYSYSYSLGVATLTRVDLTSNGVYYGDRVAVSAGGTVNGGSTFFISDTGTLTVNSSNIDLLPDILNPTVSLLTGAAVTVARPITVSANGSGATTIGGGTDVNSTFSGAIGLSKGISLSSVTTGTNLVTFSGAITDTTGSNLVTKAGSGAVELTAANSYGGGTTISAGTLFADNTTGSATGTGAVSIAASAGLRGTGTVSGAVTTASQLSFIMPGSVSTPGTLTLASLDVSNGATLDFALGTTSDRLNITGLLTAANSPGSIQLNITNSGGLAAGTYVLLNAGSFSAGVNLNDFTIDSLPSGITGNLSLVGTSLDFTVVPEPATDMEFLLGALLLALPCAARLRPLGAARVSVKR